MTTHRTPPVAGIRVLWAPCDRYDCHDLPLHEHARVNLGDAT